MGIEDIYMVFLLNVFSDEFSMMKLYFQHTGIADICMVFLLNEFSCGFSDFHLDQLHMGIADIYMVFLLNVFSDEFSKSKLHWRHMGIESIYKFFLLNVFSRLPVEFLAASFDWLRIGMILFLKAHRDQLSYQRVVDLVEMLMVCA